MKLQSDAWQMPSVQPRLEPGEIHIWRVCLDRERASARGFFEVLSADEKQKAGKYHFEQDRDNFVVARGILRQMLGGYLDMPPGEIRFSYSQYGKPALDFGMNANGLRFNVSHSNGLALYAVAREQEVGIDIECIDESFAIRPVAATCFSPSEMSVLDELPSDRQPAAFFSGWTRKEAYVKAVGEGVSMPLQEITVSLLPDDLQISMAANDRSEARNWCLVTLPFDSDYAAALAVEESIGKLSCWQWPENYQFGGSSGKAFLMQSGEVGALAFVSPRPKT